MLKLFSAIVMAAVLAGCKSSPGPLEGSWRSTGAIAMTVTFSPGQMEAMGVIEPVSYEQSGDDVIVTLTDGMAKGTSIRYSLKSPTSMHAMGQTYRKMSAP